MLEQIPSTISCRKLGNLRRELWIDELLSCFTNPPVEQYYEFTNALVEKLMRLVGEDESWG